MAKRQWHSVTSSTPTNPASGANTPRGSEGGRQRSNLIENEDQSMTRRRGVAMPEDEQGSLFDRYPGRRE